MKPRLSRRGIGFALYPPRLALLLASGSVSYGEVLRVIVNNDIGLLRLRTGQVLSTSNFLKLSEKEMAKALDEITPAKQEFSWRMLNRWHSFLYAIVRAYSPSLVVETCVLYDHSSAAILATLEDNGAGRLTSIDLPREEHQKYHVRSAIRSSRPKFERTLHRLRRTGQPPFEMELGARELLEIATKDTRRNE